MSDFLLREYRDEDIPALVELWHRVFGDPESLIKGFFRLLPAMGAGHLAELDGQIVGAAYMLRGMDHVKGNKLTRCAYIYAVATDEAYRGRGIGAALTKAAAESAKQWQAQFISTLPAEDSLYKWYDELLGVKPVLYRTRRELESKAILPCRKVSASEYLIRREAILRNREHLSVSWHVAEFQRLLCEEYGGGLYLGDGFAGFAYLEEGKAMIKELVCENEDEKPLAASSIAAAMAAETAVLFEKSASGEPYIAADSALVSSECSWNMSFD